jgi:hypothetical protein
MGQDKDVPTVLKKHLAGPTAPSPVRHVVIADVDSAAKLIDKGLSDRQPVLAGSPRFRPLPARRRQGHVTQPSGQVPAAHSVRGDEDTAQLQAIFGGANRDRTGDLLLAKRDARGG